SGATPPATRPPTKSCDSCAGPGRKGCRATKSSTPSGGTGRADASARPWVCCSSTGWPGSRGARREGASAGRRKCGSLASEGLFSFISFISFPRSLLGGGNGLPATGQEYSKTTPGWGTRALTREREKREKRDKSPERGIRPFTRERGKRGKSREVAGRPASRDRGGQRDRLRG